MKILLQFPTRSRPAQAALCLSRLAALASGKHEITVNIVTDSDDSSSRAALRAALPSDGPLRFTFRELEPTNKIAACNAWINTAHFDVLIMGSDDLFPAVMGWDDLVARRMLEHFPNLDGCLWFHDGNQSRLCTYPIMGRNWYAKAGSVYDPAYKSLWADNETHEVAAVRGRLRACLGECVLSHEHPAYTTTPNDDLYIRNETFHAEDHETYQRRKSRGFDWPDITLSILICSVTSRDKLLSRLLLLLNRQINDLPNHGARRVEVLIDCDGGAAPGEGGRPIGEKRQTLLRRALGEYIAFIDDDDVVAYNYVPRVLEAIDVFTAGAGAPPDAVSFFLRRFDGMQDRSGELYQVTGEATMHIGNARPLNHLSPVRRALALRAGFDAEKSFSEDSHYSRRLAPLVTTQAVIVPPEMYFYIDSPETSLARRFMGDPAADAGPVHSASSPVPV